MMYPVAKPKALFGDELEGSAPVRYIYVDEAGTAANEPVSVVVGIIVDADAQWQLGLTRLEELRATVPAVYRDGFISHAMSVLHDKKYRDEWSREDRLSFLRSMMAAPRELGFALALGIVRRDAGDIQDRPPHISLSQLQHLMAFRMCMAKADKYVRDYAAPDEVATVVAEDVDGMRRQLRSMVTGLKDYPYIVPPEWLRPTLLQVVSGRVPDPVEEKVTRIIDTVHFVEKNQAPLLQFADACAYGFRRYFSKQPHGEEFIKAILGYPLFLADWAGPCSSGSWFRHPPKG